MKRAALLPGLALLLVAAEEPLPLDRATEHVVQPGETLMGIANRAKVPRILIAEANGLKKPYVVKAGQRLKIPRTRRHEVVKGDTSFAVSREYAVPWKAVAVANGIDPDAPLKPGTTLLIPTIVKTPGSATAAAANDSVRFAWPATGPVRRGFTRRSLGDHHDGLDITLAQGTTVRAAAAGKVLFAGEEKKDFGKLVVIDHGDGWQTAYGFLSRITVSKGEEVNKGERIGLSGRTGRSKGPELHFEIRKDSEPVDPAKLLPEAP